MFNVILDDPPKSYKGYALRTDFRQGLKFFRNVGDDKMEETQKAKNIILCLFGAFHYGLFKDEQTIKDTWQFINWYISGGKEEQEDIGGKRLFDFNIDHGRLYAAFLQVYGIDLRNTDLHWWIFLELFASLPDSTKLSSVIEIRNKEIPKKADKKYRAELLRLKRAFAIGDYRKDQESRMDSFVKGFFKG